MHSSMGERIKAIRKEKKMTQLHLAESIFISESYLALIESDKRHPSTDVIIKLCEALGISSDYLLFGDTSQNNTALFNEWKKLTYNRSLAEIESAYKIIKIFFENLDNKNQ